MGHRLGTADPTAINESWPVKEMKTWNWTKVCLGVIRRTNKRYLTYIKATVYVNSDVR